MLRTHTLVFLMLAIAAAGVFWSCDRMSGDITENQPPVVQFVNTPLDNSQFNYAPTVYWFGYDPDGFITAYEFLDDTSTEARTIYHADTLGQHLTENYLYSRPASAWTTTQNTQETIYLLTVEHDTTEHLFAVRSVDNHGVFSEPRVRTFFRTNQAPNTPEIKKLTTDSWEEEGTYSDSLVITDTLFVGDEPSATWGGIQFVWKGTDPDSRVLNIIPLTFSYRLTNLTTGEVMPFARRLDSTNVEWVQDWSDWGDVSQVILSEATTNGRMETGNYKLELRVQDDGLTMSARNATAWFYAIRPSFLHQLLIVDENKPLDYSRSEHLRGGLSDTVITDFYHGILPEAFRLAEQLRPYVDDNFDGIPDIPEPFDSTDVTWYANKNMENSLPLSLIQQYKWVWIIDDDNPQWMGPGVTNVQARQRAMGRYLNIGGQLMISGRRIFAGSYGIPTPPFGGDYGLCNTDNGDFFCRYFKLETANAKGQFNQTNDVADFGGALTANPILPDVRVDTALVHSLRYASSRFYCLPEIDYFGRSSSQSGYDFSETIYNDSSCTAGLPYQMTDVDGEVLSSTPIQAILSPDTTGTPAGRRHTRILDVSRVLNVTRQVFGEVMGIRFYNSQWQIIVSTPEEDPVALTNWDCAVRSADSTHVILAPDTTTTVAEKHSYVAGVTRVYNVTRDAYGTVSDIRFDSILVTNPIDSHSVSNEDSRVLQTDTTHVTLGVDTAHAYVLQVSRVYNSTRDRYGVVTSLGYDSILVSVPMDIQSVTDYDGRVVRSDTMHAVLSADTTGTPAGYEHWFVREVTRVYNVTRDQYGVVTNFQRVGQMWQIFVDTPHDSTVGDTSRWLDQDVLQMDYTYVPVWRNTDVLQVDYTYAAPWRDSDSLQVDYTYLPVWRNSDLLQMDYTYIPISINHDKPIGARFIKIEGRLELDPVNFTYHFVGVQRFRTAIFTFPFSFLDRTPVNIPVYGEVTPAAAIVATQLLYFNAIRRFEVGDGGGNP